MSTNLKKICRGFDTGLRFEFKDKEYIVPSTGEIGRSFLWPGHSLLFLINPLYNSFKNGLSDSSLVEKIHSLNGGLNILNIGCGGCADIPLFESLLNETLSNNFDNYSFKVVNADLKVVVDAVKSGVHDYFFEEWDDYSYVKGDIQKDVRRYCIHNFYEGVIHPDDFDSETEDVLPVGQSYKMAEHVRNNLILVESDVIDIDFPDDTFDIVIAHQVLQYVNDKQRAKDELFRVTRNNGFIFPNGFVYQKVGDKLQRVSGRRKSYWDSEGVLPTTRINNKQLPFVLETQIHDVNYNYLFVGENFPVIKPIDFL